MTLQYCRVISYENHEMTLQYCRVISYAYFQFVCRWVTFNVDYYVVYCVCDTHVCIELSRFYPHGVCHTCVTVLKHLYCGGYRSPSSYNYRQSHPVRSMTDPFADAAGVIVHSTVGGATVHQSSSDVQPVSQTTVPGANPTAMPRNVTTPRKKQKPYVRPPSQLSPRINNADPTQNMVHTIFVDPSTIAKHDDKTAKRKTTAGVPVTIWPQYTIDCYDDKTFVVVTPTEWWLNTLLQTLRPRSTANTVRNLQTAFSELARQWIRSGLDSFSANRRTDDDSDDAGVGQRPPRHRSLSGVNATRNTLLNVRIDDASVTVLNYGKLFVLLLDNDGLLFIHNNVVAACKNISSDGDTAASASLSTKRATFTFADAMPNIRDKVMWDCDKHAWKVIYNTALGKATTYKDIDNHTLVVPVCPTEAENEANKMESYTRAIRTWNAFDTSKRDRIDTASPSSAIEQPLSLSSKWAADSASYAL